MKRVSFIIPTLVSGGAEQVMLRVLQNLDRQRFRPTLVLFEKRGPLLEELPDDVELFSLGKENYPFGFKWLRTARALARHLHQEQPDVVLSFLWYTNAITLLARPRMPVIVSERSNFTFPYEGRLMEVVRRICVGRLYPRADRVLVVADAIRAELARFPRLPAEHLTTIHNPIDCEGLTRLAEAEAAHSWFEEDQPRIVAVGRLVPQKGYAYLLEAMTRVEGRLILIGDGPDRSRLERLAEDLKIHDRVAFLGYQANPYPYLGRADLFVLPSLCEGFPNALLEAMALGIPVVASRCPTGPEEIISPEQNGLLVDVADAEALAEAMGKVLANENLKVQLGQAGKARAEDFNTKKIIAQYEAILEEVCAESVEN